MVPASPWATSNGKRMMMMFAAEVCSLLCGSGCRSNCKGFYLVLLLYGNHLTLNIHNIDL